MATTFEKSYVQMMRKHVELLGSEISKEAMKRMPRPSGYLTELFDGRWIMTADNSGEHIKKDVKPVSKTPTPLADRLKKFKV